MPDGLESPGPTTLRRRLRSLGRRAKGRHQRAFKPHAVARSQAEVHDGDGPDGENQQLARSRQAGRLFLNALKQDIGQLTGRARLAAMNWADRTRQSGLSAYKRFRPSSGGVSGFTGLASRKLAALGALKKPRLQPSRLKFLASWRKAALALMLLCALGLAAVMTWALVDVPWQDIASGTQKTVVTLETAEGTPLVTQGPYQGAYTPYDAFPPRLIDAVLSIEDRRFMEHYGVDPRGIARAFFTNLHAGSVVQGGSTITQQLIKLQYLQRDRSLKRKIQELVIAFWLEWKLGKKEILTRYLNSVYLGSGATGMPAAARIYFNKGLDELDLTQTAMLAGLMKAPSQLNPIDNPEGARGRAAVVLKAMEENGKITEQEAIAARNNFGDLHPTVPTPRSGSWFADWVSGQASEIAGDAPGSISVRTTLEPDMQRLAEQAVRRGLAGEGKKFGASQAALVAMTPDGAVVAMVGGHDYKASQFNRAASAMRQPGSTFKLFVFYAALKEGLKLSDRVLDAPIEIEGWQPKNASERYRGWVTLAEAFARSLNAATAAIAQAVGVEKIIDAARELGIDAPLKATPSLALGTSEVSLVDITGAYASVLKGKAPVEPWGIQSFKAADQPRPFRVGAQTKPETDLSAHREELLTLLQLVVERGTGREADPGEAAAGKTGTSQDNRDAWFIGFTRQLVVGVWVGNDDNSPMKGVTGGEMPAHIWRDFMKSALALKTKDETGYEAAQDNVQSAPACNIKACSRSYRSFRSSDCTYQPYRGERRLCEK